MCSTTPRNRFLLARLCGIPLVAATCSAAAAGQCYYTWERIPNPAPGLRCLGLAINNHGSVAGQIDSIGDTQSAFFWSPEEGLVQLPMVPGYISMQAKGVNDLGHVAGDMWGPAGWAGFFWDGASYTLIDLPAWANTIQVAGIDNADRVFATIYNGNTGPSSIFCWANGQLYDLGAPSGANSAFIHGSNDSADLVGWSSTGPPPIFHSWRYSNDEFGFLEPPSQLPNSDATAINNRRTVVGRASDTTSYTWHGIIWDSLVTYDIPPPTAQSDAGFLGVNVAGRATGYFEGLAVTPLVWQSGLLADLRTLVDPELPFLRRGWDINEGGTILAEENRGTVVLSPVWRVGDLTGDCHVSIEDLVIVLGNFGYGAESFPQGDIDGDGCVLLSDLALIFGHWGE